ncbi:unnamed protein product [Ectocarpus sp. 13 AM-2016]
MSKSTCPDRIKERNATFAAADEVSRKRVTQAVLAQERVEEEGGGEEHSGCGPEVSVLRPHNEGDAYPNCGPSQQRQECQCAPRHEEGSRNTRPICREEQDKFEQGIVVFALT